MIIEAYQFHASLDGVWYVCHVTVGDGKPGRREAATGERDFKSSASTSSARVCARLPRITMSSYHHGRGRRRQSSAQPHEPDDDH